MTAQYQRWLNSRFRSVLTLALLTPMQATSGWADPGVPDTISVSSTSVLPGESFEIQVRLSNDEALVGGTSGFAWGDPDLFLDSVSFVGSRVATHNPNAKIDNLISFEVLVGFFTMFPDSVPPASGLLATLWFTAEADATPGILALDSSFVPPLGEFLLIARQDNLEFTPQFVSGAVTIVADTDGDLVPDSSDNCNAVPNPLQQDSDNDQVGDLCDNCPGDHNTAQADLDADGVGDACDNCPEIANPGQSDLNNNGIGDVCEPTCCDTPGDATNNGSVNIADVTFLIARIFAAGAAPDCQDEGDANGDNSLNVADITFLIARIFAAGSEPVCGTTGA